MPPAVPDVTLATLVLDELHVTILVTSDVDESLRLPVAVNCCELDPTVPEADRLAFWGVTVIVDRSPLKTFTMVVPLIEPEVAVTVADPTATAVTFPVLSTLTKALLESSVQVRLFRLFVLPSSFTPVAVNCTVLVFPIIGEGGDMLMLCNIPLVKNPLHDSKNAATVNKSAKEDAIRKLDRFENIDFHPLIMKGV